MSIFGKILSEVVGGVIDTVDVTTSIVSDTVKLPIRLTGQFLGDNEECKDSLLKDTQRTIDRLKEQK